MKARERREAQRVAAYTKCKVCRMRTLAFVAGKIPYTVCHHCGDVQRRAL